MLHIYSCTSTAGEDEDSILGNNFGEAEDTNYVREIQKRHVSEPNRNADNTKSFIGWCWRKSFSKNCGGAEGGGGASPEWEISGPQRSNDKGPITHAENHRHKAPSDFPSARTYQRQDSVQLGFSCDDSRWSPDKTRIKAVVWNSAGLISSVFGATQS